METTDNLDSLIAAFNGALDKEWQFVNEYDWTEKKALKDKINMYSAHYAITSTRLINAEKVIKAAVAEGKGSRKDVAKVGKEARKFFEFFKNKSEDYIGKLDYSELAESEENLMGEINFQNDISHKLFGLQTKVKTIGDSTKASKVNVVLYGDVHIPILLRGIAEEEFPEILDFLQEREETEKK